MSTKIKLSTQQLLWYGGDLILQDKELIDFVENNKIKTIRYIGDCESLEPLLGKKSNHAQMCCYILKSPFSIHEVVEICNQELQCLEPGGILYLAMNKFLLKPCAIQSDNKNYDASIYDFLVSNILYPLIRYHSGIIDQGQRFNWIHPLTRFYFTNEGFNQNTK